MKTKWEKVLERIKLFAETFNAAWPILKLVLVAAGTYLVAVMVVNTGKQDEMDKYIAEYESYKKAADSSTKYAAELAAMVAVQEGKADIAKAEAEELSKKVTTLNTRTSVLVDRRNGLLAQLDSAKTVTDSLQQYIHTTVIQDSIITTQDSTIKTQKSQIVNLNTTIAHKDTSIQLLTVSRDSLLTVVKNIPEAPKNPNRTIFGIKLPSRKTSLIVGAITGAISTAVILK
jgi:hypothetical protein